MVAVLGDDALKEKIDLVFCWCDGFDLAWQKRRHERMASLGMVYDSESDANGDCRYEQLDELRYSLRSVEMYVPWVNHIYIVTDNQKPQWLKKNPKITIVDHKRIIPEKLLPTFSSVTIEMYLDKIPGLSEKFIYGNDDFFFNSPLLPKDFYKKGSPIVWLEEYRIFSEKLRKEDAEKILSSGQDNHWGRTVLKAWLVFLEKNRITEKEMPFLGPVHSFSAYTRKIFREVKQKYPEMMMVNSSPFRTNNEIMRVLIQFESIWSHGSEMHLNPLRTKALRLWSHFWKPNMFNIYQTSLDRFERELEVYRPKAFCLNNIPKKEKIRLENFFRKRFPNKAEWERE